MDARLRRVNKEISDCKNDKVSNIAIDLIDSNPFHLKGTFPGPEGTPYEGGTYEVDIVIPEGYPFQPVKMKFITRVYHPNVSSQTGAICLDILKDAWSPVLTLKSTLISLQSLLCSPEPNDPQDAQVAKHFITDRKNFNETAKNWAITYAGAGKAKGAPVVAPQVVDDPVKLAGLEEAHVQKFTEMGFDKKKVIEVLSRLNYRGSNVSNVPDNTVVEALF